MADPDMTARVERDWSGPGDEDHEPPGFEPIDLAARSPAPAEVSTATENAIALSYELSWKIRKVRNVETLRRVERLLEE